MKVVVLCSGGMDSVTALYAAKREHEVVAALSFDYGAKHNRREIPFAAENALLRPFIAMNKGQIVTAGARLGVDFSRTWSCYKGGAVHCGKCGTCVERREAFQQAGVPDPTSYSSVDPLPPKPAKTTTDG